MMNGRNIIGRMMLSALCQSGRGFLMPFVRKVVTLLIVIQLVTGSLAHASFDDLGAGARAPGMANAFTGVADDANALYYNPAGLSQLNEGEIQTLYGRFLTGLGDQSNLSTTYIGYGQPLKNGRWGTLGIGYHNFSASSLLEERTLLLSYGWKLKVHPFDWPGTWAAGATLKQLHREYKPDRFTENALNDAGTASNQSDPLFRAGKAKSNLGVDVGSLYRFGTGDRFSVGAAIMNINRPDMSIAGDQDLVPLISKLGLGFRPKWGLLTAEFRRANRLSSMADTEAAFGVERVINMGDSGLLTLRGGYAEGSRQYKVMTAGMSYQFAKAQLNYAFNFPIGNTANTQGSHQIGVSFRLGGQGVSESAVSTQADLLAAFAHNSMAADVLIARLSANSNISDRQRTRLLQLLIRKFPFDDPGLKNVHKELISYVKRPEDRPVNWAALKSTILVNVNDEDRPNADEALERYVRGDVQYMLARLALLSIASKKDPMLTALNSLGLVEMGAVSYRRQNIDSCIEYMRQLIETMPNDDVLMSAYRRLLLMRVKQADGTGDSFTPTQTMEAPATLVAPVPVASPATAASETDFELNVKNFGIALGHYFSMKGDDASTQDRRRFLKEVKNRFANTGIDLALIDKELSTLETEEKALVKPDVKPTPKIEKKAPAKKVVMPKETIKIKPAEKMVVPEKKAPSDGEREFERSWQFYQEAVQRGISDYERIEILESMLIRFGESSADPINQELEHIRRRLQR